jgi:hypothetical protein
MDRHGIVYKIQDLGPERDINKKYNIETASILTIIPGDNPTVSIVPDTTIVVVLVPSGDLSRKRIEVYSSFCENSLLTQTRMYSWKK